jgi:battenin
MSLAARARHVASLAPYTGPLVLVYFAEYSMQAGCWPAIGFPSPATKDARARFYLAANTAYQCAVFASRTFGGLLPIKHRGLWAMPIAQTALLAFFAADAALRFAYYKPLLLALAFAAGLLGGATYVCAFSLLAAEAPPPLREFSLAAASVADSLGIAAADVASVLLQGCLMRANGLADEALWRCGAPSS